MTRQLKGARSEAGAGQNKADGARSAVTGFRNIGRGACDVQDVPNSHGPLSH